MDNVKTECKYCRALDTIENMHKDVYTEEYYHEGCRPEPVEEKPTRRQSKQSLSRGRVANTGKKGGECETE